jgi:hypothetical protein
MTQPDCPAVEAGTAAQEAGTFREAMFGASRMQFAAANSSPLRAYWVRHLRGGIVEAQFEALSEDSLACATDHPGPEGCKVDVMPLEEWRDRCRAQQRANLDRAVNRRVDSREVRT